MSHRVRRIDVVRIFVGPIALALTLGAGPANAGSAGDSAATRIRTDASVGAVPGGSPGSDDFVISGTNGAQDWIINGLLDPSLQVVQGATYQFLFAYASVSHPFSVVTDPDSVVLYSDGFSTSLPVTATGTVTWNVPVDAPATLYYVCEIHNAMMRGTIDVLASAIFASTFESGGFDGWSSVVDP